MVAIKYCLTFGLAAIRKKRFGSRSYEFDTAIFRDAVTSGYINFCYSF